jgi:hypothetical protein
MTTITPVNQPSMMSCATLGPLKVVVTTLAT